MSNTSNSSCAKNGPPLKKDILDVINWIEKHPVFMTASAITLPCISVFNYVIIYHAPINMISPDIISALPLILAFIAMITVSVGGLMLFPFSVLFKKTTRKSNGSLKIFPSGSGWNKFIIRWLITLTLPGLIFGIGFIASQHWMPNEYWTNPLITIVCLIIVTSIIYWNIPSNDGKGRSLQSLPLALASSLCQMVTVINLMLEVLHTIDPKTSNAAIVGYLALALLGLAVLQVSLLVIIEATSAYAGVVKQACVGGALAVVLVCLFPPTGAKVAGNIISHSGVSSSKCAQLGLTQEAWEEFQPLHDHPPSAPSTITSTLNSLTIRHTKDLKIMSDLNGAYLVQIQGIEDSPTYRIPLEKTTYLSRCPH